jgi:hypothetical protein
MNETTRQAPRLGTTRPSLEHTSSIVRAFSIGMAVIRVGDALVNISLAVLAGPSRLALAGVVVDTISAHATVAAW